MFNISNSLSIFRLFLSFPLAFYIINDIKIVVLILIVVAYVSDLLDGWLARKLNQVTEFGKIIDPLADKVFITLAVVSLLTINKIPIWFALVIIFRDILILIGGLLSSLKLQYVIPSNYMGKFTVVIIGTTLLGIIFDIGIISIYGPYFASVFCFASLVVYLLNMIKILQQKANTTHPK